MHDHLLRVPGMPGMMPRVDWSKTQRRSLSATEIVSGLAKLDGWTLQGEGADLAIAKTYVFANFHETMAFANAVAFVAHATDHHPTLHITYSRCQVAFNTHDVKGISSTDFECASAVDALLA